MFMTVVLVADGDAAFVKEMTTELSQHDITVAKAQSEVGVLERLSGKPDVDVVLLGTSLPNSSSLDVLKKMKQLSPLSQVILVCDADSMKSGIEGMKLGAFDCILKPVDFDALLPKILDANEKKNLAERKIIEARARLIGLRRGND
jgi:DNA-binding NtrC family response regulator